MIEFLERLIRLMKAMSDELNGAETVTDRLMKKWEVILATAKDFDDLLGKFDAETTRLSAVLADLFGKLAAGGLSADEEAAVLAKGQAVAERLAALGMNPAEPIPPVV